MHGLMRARLGHVLFSLLLASIPLVRPSFAQAPGLGGSVELVDPNVFRVCADPRNLPFSNEAGEGFENKLATLFAAKLGKPVAYTYFPQATGFFRATLNSFKCDVVMGVAVGDDIVQTTNPLFHTAYVLVYRTGQGLDGVESVEDPRLQGKHVGIIAGTPPSILLVRSGLMALAKPYPLTVDTRYDAPAKSMIDDLVAGNIDAGLLWGPIAGYYARHVDDKLTVVPLLKEKGARLDFRIAMGVRHGDQDWKRTLNKVIAENRPAIDQILVEYGIPLLDDQGGIRAP